MIKSTQPVLSNVIQVYYSHCLEFFFTHFFFFYGVFGSNKKMSEEQRWFEGRRFPKEEDSWWEGGHRTGDVYTYNNILWRISLFTTSFDALIHSSRSLVLHLCLVSVIWSVDYFNCLFHSFCFCFVLFNQNNILLNHGYLNF